MNKLFVLRFCSLFLLLAAGPVSKAQKAAKNKLTSPVAYAGIEVGSKGVKLSIIETAPDNQAGGYKILKDSTVNTDFISFTEPSFRATLDGLHGLFLFVTKERKIHTSKVFTVVSSGVKMQAEKTKNHQWITRLVDSFRLRVQDPARQVEVVDVTKEAVLSHQGIVPENMRYTTFLIDIGSGNTKGGYFPYDGKPDFKLFEINWGTKSTTNAADAKCGEDKTLTNYYKQLIRVLSAAENTEISYAVNASGGYELTDNIAISGGIAWAVANLLHPEMIDNDIVPVTYADVAKFTDRIYNNYNSFSPTLLSQVSVANAEPDRDAILKTVRTIHKVFDQKALMAGGGLLLKIMRQYAAVNESKQFFLVKNGQVGWISAYVNQYK